MALDGVGKSFSVKDYVINNYLKKGEQFLYFRRYDPELKEIFEQKSKNQKDFFLLHLIYLHIYGGRIFLED